MKKAIFVLIAFFLLTFPKIQFAETQDNRGLKMIAPTPAPFEKPVDYQLPYPGLLPDNPLYPLKAIRDKLVSFFVSDPLRKANLDLLNADKRLNASLYLFNSVKQNEKKINLAISTISKAENYFEQAISKTREAKRQGMDTADILRRLSESSKKHKEVIRYLAKKSLILKEEFMFLEKRAIGFGKEVESLKSF